MKREGFRHTKSIEGHQRCAECHPELKGEAARARVDSLRAIESGMDDRDDDLEDIQSSVESLRFVVETAVTNAEIEARLCPHGCSVGHGSDCCWACPECRQ